MKFIFRLLIFIVAAALFAVGGFRFLVQLEMFDEYRYAENGNTTRVYRGVMFDISEVQETDKDGLGNIKTGLVVVYETIDGKIALAEVNSYDGNLLVLYNGQKVAQSNVQAIGRVADKLFIEGASVISLSYVVNGVAGTEVSIYIIMALALVIMIYAILLLRGTKEPKKVEAAEEVVVVSEPAKEEVVVHEQPAPQVIIKEVAAPAPQIIIQEVAAPAPQVIYGQQAPAPQVVIQEVAAPAPQVIVKEVPAEPVVQQPVAAAPVVTPAAAVVGPILPEKEYSFVDKLCLEYIAEHKIAVEPAKFGEGVGTCTFSDLVKYCEVKDESLVKIAVGRKPTSCRVINKKSYMMLYNLDGKIRMVFKCGPIFGEELIKESKGIIQVSNFPHGSVWFATEDITSVDNKMLKRLIDNAYHLALHDI